MSRMPSGTANRSATRKRGLIRCEKWMLNGWREGDVAELGQGEGLSQVRY